ncbi:unnamed protein product [Oikopleura dioica]|uniref:Uncharacterized protein n=1 Tax=Oikopleura dioica TaxID=34765 RepID=E4YRG5_OIKDI|nr:unnamed protein product [Oikopleura dioica]
MMAYKKNSKTAAASVTLTGKDRQLDRNALLEEMKGFKERFFGKPKEDDQNKKKISSADTLLEKLVGVKGRMEEDRKQRSNPNSPNMTRRNHLSSQSLPQSPLVNRSSRSKELSLARRRLPQIEVRPSTPEKQVKHTEELLPTVGSSVSESPPRMSLKFYVGFFLWGVDSDTLSMHG